MDNIRTLRLTRALKEKHGIEEDQSIYFFCPKCNKNSFSLNAVIAANKIASSSKDNMKNTFIVCPTCNHKERPLHYLLILKSMTQ